MSTFAFQLSARCRCCCCCWRRRARCADRRRRARAPRAAANLLVDMFSLSRGLSFRLLAGERVSFDSMAAAAPSKIDSSLGETLARQVSSICCFHTSSLADGTRQERARDSLARRVSAASRTRKRSRCEPPIAASCWRPSSRAACPPYGASLPALY